MVSYTAFLLLACCSCLQHTGAQSSGPYALARYKRGGGAGKKILKAKAHCYLTLATTNPPIILHEETHDIVHPTTLESGTKIIRIRANKGVIISCERNQFFNSDTLGKPPRHRGIAAVRAYCNSAKLVVDRKRNMPLSMFITPPHSNNKAILVTDDMGDLRCQSNIQDTVIATNTECGGGGVVGNEYHIAKFDAKKEPKFFIQINVCFNTDIKTTIWTQHILFGSNLNEKVSVRSSTWRDDELFNDPTTGDTWIEKAYVTENEQDLLKNKIVIHPVGKGVTRPPGTPAGLYLAKGHLSPNADFVTTGERRATFHYINALPQWQAGNNGNWVNIIESSVQKLAKDQKLDLIIITGGHGILTTVTKDKIYLKEKPDKVPVPELLWKVVYKPDKVIPNPGKAVAFVLINNPYINAAPTPLCTDICDSLDISWFNANRLDRNNGHNGITYCCEVSDFMAKIITIPIHYEGVDLDLSNVGLLRGGPSSGK